MQFKHKVLIAFVLGWLALRTFAARLIFLYVFTEAILLLDAATFIGVVYIIYERKRL